MRGVRTIGEFAAPLLSTFLSLMGVGFYISFIALYLPEVQGRGLVAVGIVQASYFLGMLIGSWRMEAIIRWIGHIQALAACGGVMTATILVQSLAPSLWVWIVTRALAGGSLACLYVAIECWMLDRCEPKRRGVVLALYMVALSGGYAAGQQVLGVVDLTSTQPFIIAALLASLGIVPVALTRRSFTVPAAEYRIGVRRLVRIAPFGSMGCLIVGVSIASLYSFLPLAAQLRNVSSTNLVTTLVVGGMAMQWPAGRLSDIFDRRRVLLGLTVGSCALSLLWIFFWSASPVVLYSLTFALGGVLFAIYPVALTQASDRLVPSQFASATAVLLILYGIGSVGGPLVTSLLMEGVGGVGLFVLLAVAMGSLAAFGAYCSMVRAPVPAEEQGDFQLMPRTTPVLSEVEAED